MEHYEVISTARSGLQKRITVTNPKSGILHLKVHLFALIGQGNIMAVNPEHPSRTYVVSAENPAEYLPLTPHFVYNDSIRIGAETYPLKVSELITKQDIDDYERLEIHHYKTSASIDTLTNEESPGICKGGKKSILLAHIKISNTWLAAGYIELQMPLLMVKPRHDLFASPYDHPERPVKWDKWEKESITRYVNTIVRIARIVTSPELRGLGLAKKLISISQKFSKERWQIRGIKPLFMEISAEMLEHFDFVSSSGLFYAGHTEGNLQRVSKDLHYMKREKYDINSGIMSLQQKYLSKIKKAAIEAKVHYEELLDRLKDLTAEPSRIKALPPDEYYLFKSVLRFPIPYHIAGLDDYSINYVSKRLKQLKLSHQNIDNPSGSEVRSKSINIVGLKVNASYELPHTRSVRAIMDCFGLEGHTFSSHLLGPINLSASPGNILLVSGPSGCGKSILLKALDPSFSSTNINVLNGPKLGDYKVAWMHEIKSDLPIIEYFSERWGLARALAALNHAGLSEALVYLKPYALLSRGQQYRARLAGLTLTSAQIWLIDEFCADLDPLTAKIVANNLRTTAMKYKIIAIVAAANHAHYIDALRPTQIFTLNQAAGSRVSTYGEYRNELYERVI